MSARMPWSEPSELDALRESSARLGADPLMVQASSGNTSMKIGDVLWIKASGKWLSEAQTPDFLIPVQLRRARTCLENAIAIPETERNGVERHRASIETAMHAVLSHKVVIHVHSVNAIAWAVRDDGRLRLTERLAAFDWQWIPYSRSGTDLAVSVQFACSRFPRTNVLILGNHGLVVCGESCNETEELLAAVERKLQLPARYATGAAVQALGTDPISQRVLAGGVLYPCQAVFLPGTVGVQRNGPLEKLLSLQAGRGSVTVSKHGVLCGKQITLAEHQMLLGLAEVVQRIPAPAPLRYLTLSEVTEIVNDDHENRQTIPIALNKIAAPYFSSIK